MQLVRELGQKIIDPKIKKWYKLNLITEADKKTIQNIVKKYHVKRILLFGFCLCPDKESNDINITIEGIFPKSFNKFYGDLLFALSKPVDVIDLSKNSKFVKMVLQEGIVLYGWL